MKKTFRFMLAVAAACTMVFSCEKPETPVEETPEPALEVSVAELAVAATAGEATFTVTSNQDWTATSEAAWVSLDPATGVASAEAVTVKVTAVDNELTEARTATVTVKAGELTKTIALTQAAAEVVKVERGLAFAAATVEVVLGEEFTAPELSGEVAGVAYSSSNTEVATVDAETGAVTILAVGEAVITATAEENDTHLAGSASYTITVAAPAPVEPDGTEANPYLVSNAAELQGVAAKLVAGATTYFKLTANVDLAGIEWAPISTTETVEDATVIKSINFDGCNYIISNAKDALFSTLYGDVKNLTVDGSTINATTTVGVIANHVKDAVIKDVEVKNSSIVSTAGEAGGAVGKVSMGILDNVKVACSVSGTQQLGVLVGRFENGKIKGCTVTGSINGTVYYIGGLAGLMLGGSVEGCSADVNAETTSTAYGRIGGFIGQVEGGSISTSHAAGSVTSKGHYGAAFIGVLAKNNEIKVSKCYATGTVNLPSDVNKSGGAGFIGAVENDGTFLISDCYTTATVTAHRWSSAFLGRMLNNCKVTITNCYTKANCTFTQPANCGALVGDVGTTTTLTYSGCVAWNVNALTLFVRPGVETAPEGNYFGTEGTISEKAKTFSWDAATWDLSGDEPTLK